MFTFFHRKPKVILDCFTADPHAYNYAPIVKASKTIPDWWKVLPKSSKIVTKTQTIHSNMKKCYGFVELFKRGLVLEHWTDMVIKVDETGYEYVCTTGKQPSEHSRETYSGSFNNHMHIKLNSPWAFREQTGAHFLYMAAEWSLDNYDFKIMPGVIEHKVNRASNVNIMIPKKSDPYQIYIPIGQPLLHIIPLDNIRVEHRMHLVTDSEMKKIDMIPPKLTGFVELIKLVKRNEKRNKGRCPF